MTSPLATGTLHAKPFAMNTSPVIANRTYATVCQSLSTHHLYSDLIGEFMGEARQYRDVAPPEGFHVLSYKPWSLQVQEQIDGVWHVIYNGPEFTTKEAALADAARQGIELDYVSHHKDHVQGRVID